MHDVGTEIAGTIMEAVANAERTEAITESYINHRTVDLQLPVKSADNPKRLREWYDRDPDPKDWILRRDDHEVDINRLHADRLLNMTEWDVKTIPAPLTYIEISNVGLLTIPGEAFAEHGLRSKDHANVDTLLVTGITNQNIGYIPTLDDLENGGYEVRACPLSPSGLRQFQDRIQELVSSGNSF